MGPQKEPEGDLLETGRKAFDGRDWHRAHDALTAADADGRLGPEDLERLGEAAWWTGRHQPCIDARERAYAGHLEAGDHRRAARVALDLVTNHRERGSMSVAAGWLKRSMRLLEDEPDCVERGYLAHALAARALSKGDLEEALGQAAAALDIGTRFGDRDLQTLGLIVEGSALISRGEVEEGMALLEEATAAAVGGELGPRVTGLVFCHMIANCHDLADYGRAGEWAEAANRWCERQAIAGFPGVCRIDRAEVMRLRGAWADAELEATLAKDELMGFHVLAAATAFYEIGMIRLLVGDDPGAEDAFRQTRELGGWEPEPGMALLRMRRGEVAAASAGLRSALEDEWDRLQRARMLPTAIDVALAGDDPAAARQALEELEATAAQYATAALVAGAAGSRAAVAAAEGDADGAVKDLRRSLKLWQEIDLPYEAAKTRVALASAYRLKGDEQAATLELEAARAALDKLGARPDVLLCDGMLRQGDASKPSPRVLRTFMFTDIVGSTALIQAIGDQAWEDLRRWHDESLRRCFAEHGGEEIDHAGDGFFVAFPDAAAALGCAVGIQRRLVEHRKSHGFAPQIRIGLHATDATQAADRYTGKGVHTAARIGALADGGEILASASTIDGLAGVTASEPREATLKGIAEPV